MTYATTMNYLQLIPLSYFLRSLKFGVFFIKASKVMIIWRAQVGHGLAQRPLSVHRHRLSLYKSIYLCGLYMSILVNGLSEYDNDWVYLPYLPPCVFIFIFCTHQSHFSHQPTTRQSFSKKYLLWTARQCRQR